MIREEHEMYAKLRAEFENETEKPYLDSAAYSTWLESITVNRMMKEQENGSDLTKNNELTPQRKIEKYDEIKEMLQKAMDDNWKPMEVMTGLIHITAFE